MRGFLRKSIARKVAFTVGTACALVVAAGLAGMLMIFRADVDDHARTSLSNLTEAMASAFSVVDQQSGRHPIPAMLAELDAIDTLTVVRVLDRDGRIVWSKHAAEVGQPLPEPLLSRFLAGRASYQRAPERDSLGLVRQLRARQSCLSCHAAHGARAAGDLLGGIHLEASQRRLTGRLSAYSNLQIAASALLVAFVCALTALALRWHLHTPLQKLHRTLTTAEAGGDLQRAEVSGEDEVGQLAADFNRLLARLTDARAAQIDQEMALVIARKDLDHQAEVGQKNLIIQQQNTELSRSLNELGLLYEVTRALSSSLELETVLGAVHEVIGKTLGFHRFSVLLWDERRARLEVRHVYGPPNPQAPVGALLSPTHGPLAEAMRKGHWVLTPDVAVLRREGPIERALPERGAFLCMPMRAKGRVLGLLTFTRPEPDSFPPEEVKLLEAIANQAGLALLNAQLYQEKLELSVTDELTKLANRRQLQTRLSMEWDRASRFGHALSLLMVDIDHFKRYNDVNGHLLGDQVLHGVARLLETSTRKVDTVARFGGEEFVVLLPGQDKAVAIAVADKLRRAVAEADFPRMATQPEGRITITVGVASHPEDAQEPTQLIDCADLALYVAKGAGRNQVVPFEASMQEAAAARAVEKQRGRERKVRRRSGDEPAGPR
ncbi:MAG TPA: diguanylate cyclase [Myxococcota bacterium]|nr:diguanylate cyclase [Myxococcota bacterium]HRY92464.1 diguanylate cyclase [Myxococcota bacterium]